MNIIQFINVNLYHKILIVTIAHFVPFKTKKANFNGGLTLIYGVNFNLKNFASILQYDRDNSFIVMEHNVYYYGFGRIK